MTAAELFRYNLERLLMRSKNLPLSVALTAWPLPDGLTPHEAYLETESRRLNLRRLRSKSRRSVPFADLDALASALGCKPADFFRPPRN